MKQKILAGVLLIVVISAVTANTFILLKQIDSCIEAVENIILEDSEAQNQAEMIFDDFLNKEKYISLTVSHEDLTSIEDCFAEMIGYLSVGDTENAQVTKSRLIHSLKHLRRLSGFNLDSII